MSKRKDLDQGRFTRAGKSRRLEERNLRLRYLIICEGEKTEPLYFEALKNTLQQPILDVCILDIEGLADNTIRLVKKAKDKAEQIYQNTRRPVDKIWVVFDRDNFSPQDFNNAIEQCNATDNMEAAWTNEAFELWYLLHFYYQDERQSRKQYGKKLSEYLTKKARVEIKYEKRNPDNYRLMTTHGNQALAIRYATRLEKLWENEHDHANHNPCTKVHRLVKEILGLPEELGIEE